MKTIKISDKTHEWLLRFSGNIQSQTGKFVSIDKSLELIRIAIEGEETPKVEKKTLTKRLSESLSKLRFGN